MRLFGLALLILSGASIFLTLSGTPAFDPDARKETILGDWRVAASPAMYDKGTYAFQRGYGFLAADALVSAETEARDELASAVQAEERARQAIAALEDSVRLDPGNAYAWASLGWAYARIADEEASLAALRISWRLAPYNRVLADTRVTLLGILTTPELSNVTLTQDDRRAVGRDVDALQKFDRGGLEFHIDALPHLAEFIVEK